MKTSRKLKDYVQNSWVRDCGVASCNLRMRQAASGNMASFLPAFRELCLRQQH
jgi:hypothetical protein